MANRWGNSGKSGWLYFGGGAPKSLQMVIAAMKLKDNPWKESYNQPRHHFKKQRHYMSTKDHLVKAMVFLVVMYGCESWITKKAECRRIDDFWTVVLEKTLDSPLDWKEIQPVHAKGNQSWLIHRKDRCWSWNSKTLAMWCEELTHWKRPWCWETLKAGGAGDDRGWDCWMASPTPWTWVWASSGSWWWTGKPGVLESMGLQSQTRLSDWNELNWPKWYYGILHYMYIW